MLILPTTQNPAQYYSNRICENICKIQVQVSCLDVRYVFLAARRGTLYLRYTAQLTYEQGNFLCYAQFSKDKAENKDSVETSRKIDRLSDLA